MPAAPGALRPLRNREFRLLFAAVAVSLTGDGIWLVAIAFQVIELGGGPVSLSLVAGAYSAGLIGFVLVGGIVADRLPRRTVMLTCDLVRAVVAAAAGILAVTGSLELWQLAVAAFAIGAAEAFFLPSYTGLLPHLLPEDELLAANGLEGTVRPLAESAAGPAIGGLAVALGSPGAAMLIDAGTFLVSAACLAAIRISGAADRERPDAAGLRSALADLREAAGYVRRTPWLWATLLFALVAVMAIVGPIEVLTPFAVQERLDGGAAEYGVLLTAFGIGAAIGALGISWGRMPRRYLTVMLAAWGLGSLPIAALGLANELWVMMLAVLIVGATAGIGEVIWGTLLQRRVPDRLRGRVSGLDWFVSLGLLPVSMTLAGPLGEAFGLTPVFIAAAVIPAVVAPIALFGGRLRADELAHPLD
jgi:H+ antiporter protein